MQLLFGICSISLFVTTVLSTSNFAFLETFNEDVITEKKWIKSSHYPDQPIAIKTSRDHGKGFENDTTLELTRELNFYAVSTKFPSPITKAEGKSLVVQYEVKFADTFTCAGGYLKLLRQSDDLDLTQFDNKTPYVIMFGPDKCGSVNKVHFILQHKNPITGEWEEKHFKDTPSAKVDKKTHLYTLHIADDNSFEIFIDKNSVKKGNLLSSMEPAVNPPKEIDDVTDKKPEDWVNEAKIPDPAAVKPEDWDESQLPLIDDPNDTKPAGWLDDAPLVIDDPTAVKPEDWLDEEDGIWESPTVPNPECDKIGCGEWNPKKIKNPFYKGKWKAPLIDNPLYKGEWSPRKVPNPNYYEDSHPSQVAAIGGIGVDIWTTNAEISFDNILITHSLDAAFEYAEKTFALKFKAEKEIGNTKPKDKPLPKKKKPSDGHSQPTLQEKLQDIYERVYEVAVEYPIPFLLLGSISASLFLVIIFGFFFSTDKKALVERGAATPMRVTQTSDSTASSSANASETATSSESKSDSNNSPLCKEPSLRTSTEVSDDKINAAENIVHQEQEEEAEETTIRRRTKTRKAT